MNLTGLHMAKNLSDESSPADTGKEYYQSNEVCKVHGDVKICGKPVDVEKFINSLEKQDNEQLDSVVTDPSIESDSGTAETEDLCDPPDASDESQSTEIESVDEIQNEEECFCQWTPRHGSQQEPTELEEK
jgi:hypothetical protein